MPFNKYWNLTDEELLHVAFTDEACSDLAHELAVRFAALLDVSEEVDGVNT
jgi:hypothetical protein